MKCGHANGQHSLVFSDFSQPLEAWLFASTRRAKPAQLLASRGITLYRIMNRHDSGAPSMISADSAFWLKNSGVENDMLLDRHPIGETEAIYA